MQKSPRSPETKPGSSEFVAFADLFPQYEAIEGHELPDKVKVGEDDFFVDNEGNRYAFRSLKGEYDPAATGPYNRNKQTVSQQFYGDGIYAANTDQGLRPLHAGSEERFAKMRYGANRGDKVLIRIDSSAEVIDARSLRRAQATGNVALGLAAGAVKWAGAWPQFTQAAFRRLNQSDVMIVAPSLSLRPASSLWKEQLPDGEKIPTRWAVIKNSEKMQIIGKADKPEVA